jgi:hypothetical protein
MTSFVMWHDNQGLQHLHLHIHAYIQQKWNVSSMTLNYIHVIFDWDVCAFGSLLKQLCANSCLDIWDVFGVGGPMQMLAHSWH